MGKNNKEHVPVFYLILYNKIRERARNKIVLYHEAMSCITIIAPHIAKPYRNAILKELEAYSLLRWLNKQTYQVTGGNIENKLRKFTYPLWGSE